MDSFTKKANNCLNLTLKWIESNLNEFDIANGKDESHRLKLLKPIGELVLISSLLQSKKIADDLPLRLLSYCWDKLDSANEILKILIARPDLIIASTIYSSFKIHGFNNVKLEQLISFLSKTDACKSIEFPRWRQLDLAHALSKLHLEDFPRNAHEGIWLEKLPEPWVITDDIAYAITHEIFYITDFGEKQERLQPEIKSYLIRWLPVWIDLYIYRENFDIVAELIVVGSCIGEKKLFRKQMQILLDYQQPSGMFNGPGNQPENGNLRQVFLYNYHTTLVSLMACANYV